MLQFVALNNTWVEYLGQTGQMISILEAAHEWQSEDKTTLKNIIHLCQDAIEGVKYRDPYDHNLTKTASVSDEYEATLRGKITQYSSKLQALDPTFIAPNPEKPSAGCFVVTATMGDAEHPTVILLREFRDQWIARKAYGRQVITFYYRHGPKAAAVIAQASWRRRASVA